MLSLLCVTGPQVIRVSRRRNIIKFYLFIYLFGVLCHFQHCTGHITTGSWKGRGNQYIQFARVLYCKLPTNGKQLPAFPLKAVPRIETRPQRWEARVLPLCHHGPRNIIKSINSNLKLVTCRCQNLTAQGAKHFKNN